MFVPVYLPVCYFINIVLHIVREEHAGYVFIVSVCIDYFISLCGQ